MSRIPIQGPSVASRSGRTTGGIPSQRAGADAFGGQVAQSLGDASTAITAVSEGLRLQHEARAGQNAANAIAGSDFTSTELQLRNEIGPGANGYHDAALAAHDEFTESILAGVEDDETRERMREHYQQERLSVSRRSAQYEFSTANQHARNTSDQALTSLDNQIRTNPDQYDELIAQGQAVIAQQPGITETQRAQMQTEWAQASSVSHWEARLEGASSLAEIEALKAEFRDEGAGWQGEMSSAGYDRVLGLLDSAGRNIQTQADAQARAALDSIDERVSDPTVLIPRDELAAVQETVLASGNAVTIARFQRVLRDEEIKAQLRGLSPAQQRDVATSRYQNPNIPSALNSAIGTTSQLFGVSAGYLAQTVEREYGAFLDGDATNWTRGNIGNNSSATGPFQFVEGTFLNVVNDPSFQAATGFNPSGMTREQILALRGDVAFATQAAGFFTMQNSQKLQRVLGRTPTDAELYMAHFLGSGGASELLRAMRDNPDANAAQMFPRAASANRSIFYTGGAAGQSSGRTVREVYNELGRRHGATSDTTSQVAFDDIDTVNDILSATEQGVRDDPMLWAAGVGRTVLGDIFSEGGMGARGEGAMSVADMYDIPYEDMQPFTQSEVERLSSDLANADADQAMAILASIQDMGPEMAQAGMAQLGEDGNVYGYAAGLMAHQGNGVVAGDVVRGQKRIDENPAILTTAGADRASLDTAFTAATGGALMGAAPAQRQAIFDASMAHYVETHVARGGQGAFDPAKFQQSVQTVMGGSEQRPAVDVVNGVSTVLPLDMTADEMETVLDRMTLGDYMLMSVDGRVPYYMNGTITEPEDIAYEGEFEAIGGGAYRIRMGDGGYLVTSDEGVNGRPRPFVMEFNPDVVDRLTLSSEDRTQQLIDQFPGTDTGEVPRERAERVPEPVILDPDTGLPAREEGDTMILDPDTGELLN